MVFYTPVSSFLEKYGRVSSNVTKAWKKNMATEQGRATPTLRLAVPGMGPLSFRGRVSKHWVLSSLGLDPCGLTFPVAHLPDNKICPTNVHAWHRMSPQTESGPHLGDETGRDASLDEGGPSPFPG